MNSILQCLLNLDTFSIDLIRNFELLKSLMEQENQEYNLDSIRHECYLLGYGINKFKI